MDASAAWEEVDVSGTVLVLLGRSDMPPNIVELEDEEAAGDEGTNRGAAAPEVLGW